MKTKTFEYFLKIFSERYSVAESAKIARVAANLIEPLNKKETEKVRQLLEELE